RPPGPPRRRPRSFALTGQAKRAPERKLSSSVDFANIRKLCDFLVRRAPPVRRDQGDDVKDATVNPNGSDAEALVSRLAPRLARPVTSLKTSSGRSPRSVSI